jgi:hypothetical protein
MPSADVHLARGEARDTVMESMAHVKLITNSNKQYDHDEWIKVTKTVRRVLTETFNEHSNGKGMSELLDKALNEVNAIKTTQSVHYQTILQASKEAAAKATKAAKAKDVSAAVIAPLILDIEMARAEADRCNMYNQTVVGTKEGMVLALRKIVGAHIIDKIAKTPDGSDNVSIDDYTLHDIIQCATDHATRPDIDDVLALMTGFYETQFDFRETVNQNMLKLKEEATKLKQFGLSINEPKLMLVLVANINRAAKSGRWGTEFQNTISTIKKAYPYNHIHEATSMAKVLTECAEADSARNVRDAPAPGDKALSAHRSILLGAQSDCSSDTYWDEYDRKYCNKEAYINSDGEAYLTKRHKRETKRNERFSRGAKGSSSSVNSSSIASSSSDSASTKTVAEVIDCKHCKKFKRTKPHPAKVPIDKCMWNTEYVGYRFENVCKAMGLKYRSKDKYPRNNKDEWKQHKKADKDKEKKDA